jgi:hypothetical protein
MNCQQSAITLLPPSKSKIRILTLNRRQTQLLRNLGILNPRSILKRHTPHQLGQVRGTRDRAAAPERLELDVADGVVVGVHADLQLHDVAAGRRADKSCSNVRVGLGHGTYIARAAVVVEQCWGC